MSPCSRCPGGLTTERTRSNSTAACVADLGYYYLRGTAVACALGTYKDFKGNADCTECAEGVTTEFNTVAKTAPATATVSRRVLLPARTGSVVATPTAPTCLVCQYLTLRTPSPALSPCAEVVMGYAFASGVASLCPANTYNDKQGLTMAAASGTVDCTPCGGNLVTMPNVTGATSSSACVAPPGFGFNPATGTATQCAAGRFNPGYNREACTSCGLGTITSAPGSDADGDCYVPPGHYTAVGADGVTLTGAVCPADTFGRVNSTYGLVAFACDKCPPNSRTLSVTGSTSGAACKAPPGFGWYDAQVKRCEFGYFNTGNNQNECTFCGEGYNTTTSSTPSTTAIEGTDALSRCQVAAGWFVSDPANLAAGLSQCPRGSYKELIGSVNCTACPAATTTTIVSGATALSDCDACDPGFGRASTNLSAPSCTICPTGEFSPGLVSGGAACGAACPNPALFDAAGDVMVSRPVGAAARLPGTARARARVRA